MGRASRFLLHTLHRCRRFYWWLIRPVTIGVRGIVVENTGGRILLVQHTYQKGWYLPGGKVQRGESLLDALKREIAQETGIEIKDSTPAIVGAYSSFAESKSDHIVVFLIRDWSQMSMTSHFEIAEVRFCSPSDLPEGTSAATQRRIAEYLGQSSLSSKW